MLKTLERYFFGARVERARREGYATGQPGYAQFELGRLASSDASALASTHEGLGSALLLQRGAILFLLDALRSRTAPGATSSAGEDTERALLALPQLSAILEKLDPESRLDVETLLDRETWRDRIATLDPTERERTFSALSRVARELAEPLELAADPVRRAEMSSVGARVIVAALVLVALVLIAGKLLQRKNLALHQPVITSSAEPNVRANPRGLVDGDLRNMGFHTKKGRNQSATIDLGQHRSITSVIVYNRVDCCQIRAVPLRLELSLDGVTYTQVARETEAFAVWKVPLPPTPTRFVRLVDEANNFFHLTEVEVY